jgi:hypothetical protein
VRFGEGQEFYVQWRQRFSRAFLETRFPGGGWKQAIIGEGDRPGYAPDDKVVWSCTQLEVVVSRRQHPSRIRSAADPILKHDRPIGSLLALVQLDAGVPVLYRRTTPSELRISVLRPMNRFVNACSRASA